MTRKGIPASQFFTGRSFHAHERQPLPVIPLSYQEPSIEIVPPREEQAITRVFDAARETVERLEAERVEHVGGEWSPAQFARAS